MAKYQVISRPVGQAEHIWIIFCLLYFAREF